MALVTEIVLDSELEWLLEQLDLQDVVLDFEFYSSDVPSEYESHFNSAFHFLDKKFKRYHKLYKATYYRHPRLNGHGYKWNTEELTGIQLSFAQFWGTDLEEAVPLGNNSWSIPDVDGFKTAFFFPPYGLRKPHEQSLALFEKLNKRLFCDASRESTVIYSWSNLCSGYFDAGLEFWGAFLWTISHSENNIISVIGASTSD